MNRYVRDFAFFGMTCALLAGCGDSQPATFSGPSGAGAAGQSAIGGGATSGTGGNSSATSGTGPGGTGGAANAGSAGVAGAAGTTSTAGAAGSGGAAGSAGAAGAGGGPATGCKPEWQLCDGFEGAIPGTPDSAFTIVTHYTATVQVTADKFAHGAHSVHIKIPDHGDGDPDGTAGYIAETKTFPAINNTFWGRMMVFFHPATGLPESHWANVQASGTKNDPAHDLLRVGGGNKAPGIMNTNQYPPDSFGYSATQVIPVDKWSCWEWQMDGKDPMKTNVHFFIDETEVSDVAVVNGLAVTGANQKFIAPNFEKVELGWQFWHDDSGKRFTGGDMWLDDVVVDDQRIHCPTM